MSYISITFFIFLICLLLVYRLTPDRHKWMVLLAFSLIFYVINGQIELLFILGTSLVVYLASRRIEGLWDACDKEISESAASTQSMKNSESTVFSLSKKANKGTDLPTSKKHRVSAVSAPSKDLSKSTDSFPSKKQIRQKYYIRSRHTLLVALFICIGYLGWCKYGANILNLASLITHRSLAMRIIMPLGVSYYTFSAIGYLADLHWRKIRPEHSYPKLLLAMIYFPHIVEGPIARYSNFLTQLNSLTFPDYDRICKGLQLMMWGMFKKLVIADRLSIFVTSVFGNIEANWGLVYIVAFIFAAFQAYTDFSGCMDIVMGISDIIGIKLDLNFNRPFFSRSAGELWTRWHITLGNWFYNYIMVPVATSSMMRSLRRKVSKRYGDWGLRAIMPIFPSVIVWFTTGIWHGNGMTFIVWGMYWAVIISTTTLLADKIWALKAHLHINTESRGWICFQRVRTFLLYVISLLAVVPGTLRRSVTVFTHIVKSWNPWIFWDGTLYNYGLDNRNFILAILAMMFMLYVESIQERMNVRDAIGRTNIILRWGVLYLGIFVILIFGIYGPGYSATSFQYENF